MATAELSTGNELRLQEILTPEEAAAYLRVPEDALLKLADERAIPAQKIRNEWRFLKRALNDWLRYGDRSYRKGQPDQPEFSLDSPIAEELFFLLEQFLLHKLKEKASPKTGSKEAVLKYFGVFEDDCDLEERLADFRAMREINGVRPLGECFLLPTD